MAERQGAPLIFPTIFPVILPAIFPATSMLSSAGHVNCVKSPQLKLRSQRVPLTNCTFLSQLLRLTLPESWEAECKRVQRRKEKGRSCLEKGLRSYPLRDYVETTPCCTSFAQFQRENALNFPLIPFSGKPNNLAKKYMTLRFLGENF